jgi:hypothetical protein
MSRPDHSFARASQRWTPEELDVMNSQLGLMKVDDLAKLLNRSCNSVKNKAVEINRSFALSASNRHGPHLYWTEERVLEGLKRFITETRGMLPTSDEPYLPIKKGRSDLPDTIHIYRYFGSFPRAWKAAGAPDRRLNFTNADWTAEEDDYLLDHAGSMRLVDIAHHLNRSYSAVRVRIGSKGHKITARANQGYLSAALLAKEFNTSYTRVLLLLQDRHLPGFYNRKRHCWQVDLGAITEEHKELLKAQRRTHQNGPIDRGDYYQRYGLKRILMGGRLQCVPA